MYKVGLVKSINRILKTPLKTRVMRPPFGSLLYTLKDRKFDEEYKLKATMYTYEAISRYDPRVKIEKVDFKVKPVSGVVVLSITLANGEVIEVEND